MFRFLTFVLLVTLFGSPAWAGASSGALGAALSGEPVPPGGRFSADWPQVGGGPDRAGYQPVATHAHRLRPLWTAPARRGGEQIGGAAVVGGTVFRTSGGPSGQIRRYDAAAGTDLGPIVDLPGRTFGQLAVVGAAVVNAAVVGAAVVVGSRSLTADERFLDSYTMDGNPKWEISLGSGPDEAFTVGAGLVVLSSGTAVSAYALPDGHPVWTATMPGTAVGSPAATAAGLAAPVLAGGYVLQGSSTSLSAFDQRTGHPAWQVEADGSEVLASGGLVFTVGSGGVCAFAVTDGRLRWCDTAGLAEPMHATAGGGRLFVTDAHGHLAALRADSGAALWTASYAVPWASAASAWAPVNGGGMVFTVAYHFGFVAGVPKHLFELLAVDAADGAVLRRVPLDFDAMHGDEPLLLSSDRVYFAAVQTLFAYAL